MLAEFIFFDNTSTSSKSPPKNAITTSIPPIPVRTLVQKCKLSFERAPSYTGTMPSFYQVAYLPVMFYSVRTPTAFGGVRIKHHGTKKSLQKWVGNEQFQVQ